MKIPHIIPDARAREYAVRASVDPRTIQKVAAGMPVKTIDGDRARRVLIEAGVITAPTGQAA